MLKTKNLKTIPKTSFVFIFYILLQNSGNSHMLLKSSYFSASFLPCLAVNILISFLNQISIFLQSGCPFQSSTLQPELTMSH